MTLHNLALTESTTGASGLGLRRLAFLLELGPPACPFETFGNILLLCCKHEMYDTAADILAEHAHLTYKYLSPVREHTKALFFYNAKHVLFYRFTNIVFIRSARRTDYGANVAGRG